VVKLKTKKMKKNEFRNFVGIDVSKQTFDAAFIFNEEINKVVHQQFSNDLKGIREMIKYLKSNKGVTAKNTLVCFEHTGMYGRKLTYSLFEKGWNVWLETPVAILRSIGLQRGKSDKVDAKRIVVYAMKNYDRARLWEAPRKEVAALRELNSTRNSLIKVLKSLRMRFSEHNESGNKEISDLIRKSTRNAIKGIEKDIKQVEEAIA
jgi:transposase